MRSTHAANAIAALCDEVERLLNIKEPSERVRREQEQDHRLLIVATMGTAQAEPRQHKHNRNYILRRQEAGLVSGVPTTRRIIGKREIDVYRNGLMFERDHVVGVRGGSR
jgi:hypothetical protein